MCISKRRNSLRNVIFSYYMLVEMKYKEGESFVSNGSFRQYGGNVNDSGIGGHFGQITLKQQLQ